MTPQERQLIVDLFDRLSTLENTPRDPAAARAIADGMSRAPNAIYPLVQTVLVQDEALKRANARIQELESGNAEAPNENTGFLDSMRGALFGREAPSRGSVPPVRSRADDAMPPEQERSAPPYGAPSYGAPPYGAPPYAAPPMGAPGGSFLGSAASTAAGVIGGSLLLDGIRSMFGHGHSLGAYERMPERSPWDNKGSGSELAREAGSGDIDSGKDAGKDASHEHEAAGLVDTADDSADDYDSNDDADGDFDGGDYGDSDVA
jgi:uncharacterized protein